MEYRRAHGYPPFKRAILVSFSGPSEAQAAASIRHTAARLRELWKKRVEVSEPGAAPIARVEGKFRFQLFLLVDKVPELMGDLKREVLAPKWPTGVRATIDVDAQDLL